MATPNTPSLIKYTGNGSTTEFGIPFPYNNRDYVKLKVKYGSETEQDVPADNFDFISDNLIRFPGSDSSLPVLTDADILVIYRQTPSGNIFVFSNQARLFPEDVMKADDTLSQQIQELIAEFSRTIKVDITSSDNNPDEIIAAIYAAEASAKAYAEASLGYATQSADQADRSETEADRSETEAGNSAASAESAEAWAKNAKGMLGDVLITERTDTPYGRLEMDGASSVNINGAVMDYNQANFKDVVAALDDGRFSSVSLADFQSALDVAGWCGKFGYDPVAKTFRTPKVTNRYQIGIVPNADGSNRNLGRVLAYDSSSKGLKPYLKIYTDGWCEFADYITNSGATNLNFSFDLPYQMNDNHFYFERTPQTVAGSAVTSYQFGVGYNSKTVSSVSFAKEKDTSVYGWDWTVRGYISDSEFQSKVGDRINQRFLIIAYNANEEVSIADYEQVLNNYTTNMIERIRTADVLPVVMPSFIPYLSDDILHTGEVWLDGGMIPLSDSLKAALDSGNLRSISIASFETKLSANGWCGVYGYDSDTGTVRSPKITNMAQYGVIPADDGSNRNIGRTLFSSVSQTAIGNLDGYGRIETYTDGWREESGYDNRGSGSQVLFIEQYKNTPEVNATMVWLGDSYVRGVNVNNAPTTSGFVWHTPTGGSGWEADASGRCIWSARGYVNIPSEYSVPKFKTNISNIYTMASDAQWNQFLSQLANKADLTFANVSEENARKLKGNRIWVSDEYGWASNTTVISSHNLNLTDDQLKRANVRCLLKCLIPEKGYVAGEYAGVCGIDWANLGTSNLVPWVTMNTIGIRVSTGLTGINKDATTWGAFTPAKWRLVFVIEW